MLGWLSNWFNEPEVPQDYRRSHYVVLGLLVIAGAVARFWGLDNVGLHGDEETVALAAMGVLATGDPVLPSGMFYSRALLHTYMMAASASIFGVSEWAWRLPSAVIGSLLGLSAFFMGKRFLSPSYNLAFVATITFLPALIEISQTARMYVFFVAGVMLFGACIFRWERDGRVSSLILAILAWTLTLQFHQLAIFSALLFPYPGFAQRSPRLLIQGTIAFLFAGAIFKGFMAWIRSNYPSDSERPLETLVESSEPGLDSVFSAADWLPPVILVIAVGLLALFYVKHRERGWTVGVPVAFLITGMVANVLFHYHLGVIFFVAGIVLWMRNGLPTKRRLLTITALAAIICAIQVWDLAGTGLFPGRKVIGALIGEPSIWPAIRFAGFSPLAALALGIVLLAALHRLATGHAIPNSVLFFGFAVWVPLLIIGYFLWFLPPRYTFGQLPFFLMVTFAGVFWLLRDLMGVKQRMAAYAVATALAVVVVNPISLMATVNPGYDRFPDHKGAAEYIHAATDSEDTILIAEDALQQTYYLGRVDYWLREMGDAQSYTIVRDGELLDQYTGARVLGTGVELEKILLANRGKDVFIIGSGENFVGGSRLFRGQGIAEILSSSLLEEVYVGRDGRTKVWRNVREISEFLGAASYPECCGACPCLSAKMK